MRPATPVIERLLPKVQYRSGCWIFTGSLSHGYGQIGSGGRFGRPLPVHRVTYEEFVGPIPDGFDIDHLCREPACCNPLHLEAVPHRVNMLRGNTWAARHVAVTHCPSGHEYSPDNTSITKRGERKCRECDRIRSRAYARRKAAEATKES